MKNGEICEFEGAWHDGGRGGYGLKCARGAQVSRDAYFSNTGPGGEGDLTIMAAVLSWSILNNCILVLQLL